MPKAKSGARGARSGRAPRAVEPAAAIEAPTIVRMLEGEPLRHVAAQLADGDLTCFRLVSAAFRAHSAPPKAKPRSAFTRSLALVEFAWAELPGFRDGSTSELLVLAAGEGQIDVLAWLRAAGCAWTRGVPARAALHGRFEALRWAREHGCPWNWWTCSCAAEGGHLEALRWAREQGCPWDASTCYAAAKGGHLEVLRWAREQGCPWSPYTCYRAAQAGHLEVLRWARAHGCPCPPHLADR